MGGGLQRCVPCTHSAAEPRAACCGCDRGQRRPVGQLSIAAAALAAGGPKLRTTCLTEDLFAVAVMRSAAKDLKVAVVAVGRHRGRPSLSRGQNPVHRGPAPREALGHTSSVAAIWRREHVASGHNAPMGWEHARTPYNVRLMSTGRNDAEATAHTRAHYARTPNYVPRCVMSGDGGWERRRSVVARGFAPASDDATNLKQSNLAIY